MRSTSSPSRMSSSTAAPQSAAASRSTTMRRAVSPQGTLIEAGHTRLASSAIRTDRHVAPPPGRLLRSRKAAGLPPVVDAVGPYSRRGGLRGLPQASQGEPSADRRLCLQHAGRDRRACRGSPEGFRVPEDLSIVTLDGEDANYTAPPLTAIAMPLNEMGASGGRTGCYDRWARTPRMSLSM